MYTPLFPSKYTRFNADVAILPIRAEASHRSEELSQLLFMEPYTVEGPTEGGKWMRIRTFYDNYTGYIPIPHGRKLAGNAFDEPFFPETIISAGERADSSVFATLLSPGGRILVNLALPTGCIIPHGLNERFELNFAGLVIRLSGDTQRLIRLDDAHISPAEFANYYLNAAYRWGGRTLSGIDCSGFSQLFARLNGQFIARDAGDQALMGEPVTFEQLKSGDLAFFSEPNGEKITHVGIADAAKHAELEGINEALSVCHASDRVRFDTLSSDGVYLDPQMLSHRFRCARRIL